ncbi:MAG: Anti-sigma factor antagonist [Acidimicrobiales bacterium]|nr:Anti-sigma factor antagonist [Acidimicrobiales bacterium]
MVRVFGDLDRALAGSLSRCLAGLSDGGPADLVVDLDGVRFCDSNGLGALLGAHCRIDGLGGHLELRQAVPEVRHVLEERGLDRVLHLV